MNDEVNISRLVFGIIIFILSLLFLIYTFRKAKKDKNYDAMSYSFDVNIVVGTGIILLASIFLICRELLKMKFILILLILLPFTGLAQNKDCADLKHGVFEVHENNETVGQIYRKGNYQLEDYLDGKKFKIAKIREENCLFYINSLEIESDLDTVTMFTRYDKIKDGHYAFLAKPIYLDIDYEYRGKIKKISDDIAPDVLKVFEKLESKSDNDR
jgi:hypothetical protein